jgi:hypothetical protein
MKYPDLLGTDPMDGTVGNILKTWIKQYRIPREKERAKLLRAAAALEVEKASSLNIWPLILTSIRWLLKNVFIGSADQPMLYPLSAEHSFSKSNNLTIFMAKRGALDFYSIQMGVACLLN